MNYLRPFLYLLPLILLTGCSSPVLDPAGDIAAQQRDLLIDSLFFMLLIIVPVMGFTAWFAWHYRASNKNARYEPEWEHSTHLELLIWSAPLLIIICIGALTWVGTHLLDPYRKLDRVSPGHAVSQNIKPLEIEVVALDWKWLFFYPEYGIASVNDMAVPVDRPIDFHITSATVMNSFYIPTLAGQIYAMPAMETRLHSVANRTGAFQGFSANYSGAGFSGMHFAFRSLSENDFNTWVDGIKADGDKLDRSAYLVLAKPSENEPVHHYASADKNLYKSILNLCVTDNNACMNTMHDMSGMHHHKMPKSHDHESRD